MDAAARGDLAEVRRLVSSSGGGKSVDAADEAGSTALHAASQSGRREVAAALVDMGADVNKKVRKETIEAETSHWSTSNDNKSSFNCSSNN